MSNAIFPLGRGHFLDANIDWSADNIKAVLVRDTYTYDANDEFLADIGATTNGATANLGSKTSTQGVADAADTSLVATAAVACNAIVLYKDTGVSATSNLIVYIDTATGLPFTPAAGGTVNIVWDSGANKIFKL